MLNQSFKTSEGYKWGGLGVVIFASFLFNALIWLVLARLPGKHGRGQSPSHKVINMSTCMRRKPCTV